MNPGVIEVKEKVTEKFSGKRKQNYSIKDEREKLMRGKIDHREKALAYCYEMLIKKMIVKKKIETVEDEK